MNCTFYMIFSSVSGVQPNYLDHLWICLSVFFLYIACISVYLKLSIIFQHCVGKWDGKQTDYRI